MLHINILLLLKTKMRGNDSNKSNQLNPNNLW